MTGGRILVVDDNRDMANGIAMLLGEADMAVQVAYSAKSALGLMETEVFQLVLSDIRMPRTSGVDLLKNIRSRWPLTKVVLLTAYGSIDSAVDAMKSGASDYLTKPFDNDTLVEVVRRNLAAAAASAGFDSAVVGDVTAAIAANDLLPGLKCALEVLLRATGADDGEIFLCEPEGSDSLLSAWAGSDGDALSERVRFPMGVGYPGIVAAAGTPLWPQGGLGDDPRYLRRTVVDAGIRSFVAVPLPGARRALGSIHLMSRRDDLPVPSVCALLERAADPISNAVRAGLGALRQSVDRTCGSHSLDDPTGQPLRAILELMRQVAGARSGTLALIDPRSGRPDRVVSTGATSLICSHIEAGAWGECPSITAAHGLVADPGRRQWPEYCRRGLPRRAASPCCLPLAVDGDLYGLVVLDFGREGTDHATGHLVPLLTMAQQVAIRLRAHRTGLVVAADSHDNAIVVEDHVVPPLELRCLGPFAVSRGGQPISAEAFTRSKALLLLKLLALKAGAPVNRDVLIERLWPEAQPHLGANRLHGVVHDLRAGIEPRGPEREWQYVRNRDDLYYLNMTAPIDIDVSRFRRLVAQGLASSSDDDGESIACLQQAVELYRGDLFEDDPVAEWCEAEREELKACLTSALDRLAQLYLGQARTEEALECFRRATRSQPFRDDVLLARMRLLVSCGRSSEALAAYTDHRRLLQDELDAEPSASLRALHGQLLRSLREHVRT
ncbi:MAG: response regulator [Acidobacteriota bacterium]